MFGLLLNGTAFLEGKTPRDVRIQYRDDEDTFVNLSSNDDLIDACRCLRPVDNSEDLYRLSFRVHATATPVQAVPVRTERTIVNEPAQRRCVSPTPRKQLHFMKQSTTAEMTKHRSPLQVFLQKKKLCSRICNKRFGHNANPVNYKST